MITPNNLLDVAEFLKGRKEEAFVRCVVNRSYYATFLCLREWLVSQGVHVPTQGRISSHKFIIECLEKSSKQPRHIAPGNPKGQIQYKLVGQIWSRLRQLFQDRLNADYEPGIRFTPNYSPDSIKRAMTTMRDFQSLQGSPTEKHIITTSRSYATVTGQ